VVSLTGKSLQYSSDRRMDICDFRVVSECEVSEGPERKWSRYVEGCPTKVQIPIIILSLGLYSL
jgi:hypothetical protein